MAAAAPPAGAAAPQAASGRAARPVEAQMPSLRVMVECALCDQCVPLSEKDDHLYADFLEVRATELRGRPTATQADGDAGHVPRPRLAPSMCRLPSHLMHRLPCACSAWRSMVWTWQRKWCTHSTTTQMCAAMLSAPCRGKRGPNVVDQGACRSAILAQRASVSCVQAQDQLTASSLFLTARQRSPHHSSCVLLCRSRPHKDICKTS